MSEETKHTYLADLTEFARIFGFKVKDGKKNFGCVWHDYYEIFADDCHPVRVLTSAFDNEYFDITKRNHIAIMASRGEVSRFEPPPNHAELQRQTDDLLYKKLPGMKIAWREKPKKVPTPCGCDVITVKHQIVLPKYSSLEELKLIQSICT